MDTVFMNSENSKASQTKSQTINLKIRDKYVSLSNLSIYYTWKNIKQSYKNKFKTFGPKWNHKLPDGSYSVSNIQDYFYYIIKKHKTVTESSYKNIRKSNRKQNRIYN